MHLLDWMIVAAFVLGLTVVAVRTAKYNRSVADFLAANRCAGRYLLAVADGMVAFGVVSIIFFFEIFYKAGFTAQWWQIAIGPFPLVMYLTGWVVYRYRQTRSMTLLQFFEQRYSKSFRVFVGVLSFWVFLVTMGIIPGTAARFFIHSCGLPDSFMLAGLTVPTFHVVMLALLATSLFFTFIGGQIVVIVTDYLQGMFCNIVLLILMVFIMLMFGWSQIDSGLSLAPPEASMMHPFHTQDTQNYDVWFFVIMGFNFFFVYPAWQGTQAFNSAALNPHEARMARVLSQIRGIVQFNAIMLLPIIAFVVMHHPSFASVATSVQTQLSHLPTEYLRSQMTVPVAISRVIPMGLFGLFIAAMLGCMIASMDTMLHAWGCIFVQDVILPFRKQPFSRGTHMWMLRLATVGVATFLFCFSIFYKQKQDIAMFWALFSSFYYGGAGAALVFGLYWKRGSTAGAWAGILTSILLTTFFIYSCEYRPQVNAAMENYLGMRLDGQRISFFIVIMAILAYVLVSFFGKRPPHDMDKLLHRGQYAVEQVAEGEDGAPVKGWRAALGINEHFTPKDRLVYYLILAHSGVLVASFIVFSTCSMIFHFTDLFWSRLWQVYLWFVIVIGTIIVIWFLIGGGQNLKDLFRRLSAARRNDLDDGTVVKHKNLGE